MIFLIVLEVFVNTIIKEFSFIKMKNEITDQTSDALYFSLLGEGCVCEIKFHFN